LKDAVHLGGGKVVSLCLPYGEDSVCIEVDFGNRICIQRWSE